MTSALRVNLSGSGLSPVPNNRLGSRTNRFSLCHGSLGYLTVSEPCLALLLPIGTFMLSSKPSLAAVSSLLAFLKGLLFLIPNRAGSSSSCGRRAPLSLDPADDLRLLGLGLVV